tara:strand:+ start:1526 stop:2245 length:720 start_codon:yes stop_codon:yes gene_type:complete
MPNFKKEGRGFKMNFPGFGKGTGWMGGSPLSKKNDEVREARKAKRAALVPEDGESGLPYSPLNKLTKEERKESRAKVKELRGEKRAARVRGDKETVKAKKEAIQAERKARRTKRKEGRTKVAPTSIEANSAEAYGGEEGAGKGGPQTQVNKNKNKDSKTTTPAANETKKNEVKKPKRTYSEAYKKRDKKIYGDLTEAEYTAEAKRQKASYKKTGKWDAPKTAMKSMSKAYDRAYKNDPY